MRVEFEGVSRSSSGDGVGESRSSASLFDFGAGVGKASMLVAGFEVGSSGLGGGNRKSESVVFTSESVVESSFGIGTWFESRPAAGGDRYRFSHSGGGSAGLSEGEGVLSTRVSADPDLDVALSFGSDEF